VCVSKLASQLIITKESGLRTRTRMARLSRNLSHNLLARLVPRRFEREYLLRAISHVNFATMDYSRPKRSYAEVVSGSSKCFTYTFLYKLQSP